MTKSQLWAALWMAALISELLVFNFDSLLILSLYHNGIKALEAEAQATRAEIIPNFFLSQYLLLIKSHIILRTAYSLILAFHCSCLKPSSWHTFLTPLMNKGLLWDLCSVIQFSSLYSPSPWICWIWISVCTSQLSIFQPPQPHSLWLPPDSVKDDKENNKPSIYVISCNMMFSQWLWGRTAATRQPHACKAWLYRFDLWNTISPHIHYYYCTQLHFFPTLAAWIDCTIYLLCDRF